MTEVPMPRLLNVMWGRETPDQPARRGPKPTLTLEQIVATAAGIADREGLAAVSMARVAKDLGFTTMSLYRYVASKDELEIAMLDHAYGPAKIPWTSDANQLTWRDRLEAWARALRWGVLHRPWILQVPIKQPPLGPNQSEWMEVGLAAMAGVALSEQAKLSSLLLVDVYTRGQTQLALQLTGSGSDEAARLYGYRLWALTDDTRFPHLRAALAEGSLTDDEGDFGEEEFTFGLRTVLDGVQANIDRVVRSGPLRSQT